MLYLRSSFLEFSKKSEMKRDSEKDIEREEKNEEKIFMLFEFV